MSHSAQLHTEQQHLTLRDNNNVSITGPAYEHLDQLTARKMIENTLFDKASTFSYHNRLRLSFSVREEYKSDFVLIRGLIEFHRTRNLKFTFDKNSRSIQTDIPGSEADQLHSFLQQISEWFKKEKQFKLALKIVVDFERRYGAERDSVYQIMKNASVSPT